MSLFCIPYFPWLSMLSVVPDLCALNLLLRTSHVPSPSPGLSKSTTVPQDQVGTHNSHHPAATQATAHHRHDTSARMLRFPRFHVSLVLLVVVVCAGDVWPPVGGSAKQGGGRPERTRKEKPEGSRKLFIGNLSYNIDDDTICEFFKDCGELVGLRWLTHQGTEEFRVGNLILVSVPLQLPHFLPDSLTPYRPLTSLCMAEWLLASCALVISCGCMCCAQCLSSVCRSLFAPWLMVYPLPSGVTNTAL